MAEAPALELALGSAASHDSRHDLLYATLDEFAPSAIEECDDAGRVWRVYFGSPSSRDAAAAALARMGRDAVASVTAVDVPDGDWARRSQARLTAVGIGRIIVSPPWDPAASGPAAGTGAIVIVIEPSTGFGTGHHPTTRLCLQLLQDVPLAGRRVLDVGTGSGVLAIAAARLGASAVTAIDRDPDAVNNARGNVEINDVAGLVEVGVQDLATTSAGGADVVVANLTGAALQQSAGTLADLTAGGGTLLVSGFAPDELTRIEEAFGVPAADVRVEDGWAAARFIPRPTET